MKSLSVSCRIIDSICQDELSCLEEMNAKFPNCYLGECYSLIIHHTYVKVNYLYKSLSVLYSLKLIITSFYIHHSQLFLRYNLARTFSFINSYSQYFRYDEAWTRRLEAGSRLQNLQSSLQTWPNPCGISLALFLISSYVYLHRSPDNSNTLYLPYFYDDDTFLTSFDSVARFAAVSSINDLDIFFKDQHKMMICKSQNRRYILKNFNRTQKRLGRIKTRRCIKGANLEKKCQILSSRCLTSQYSDVPIVLSSSTLLGVEPRGLSARGGNSAAEPSKPSLGSRNSLLNSHWLVLKSSSKCFVHKIQLCQSTKTCKTPVMSFYFPL